MPPSVSLRATMAVVRLPVPAWRLAPLSLLFIAVVIHSWVNLDLNLHPHALLPHGTIDKARIHAVPPHRNATLFCAKSLNCMDVDGDAGEDIEKKAQYDPELVTTNKTNPSVAQNSTNSTEKKTNYRKSVAELLHELTASIEQIQDENRRRHIEHLVHVHMTDSPAKTAGSWVEKPASLAKRSSPEMLQCLDLERQGNCYVSTYNISSDDKGKLSRQSAMKKGDVKNSPGILKGYDPYMWESHDEAYKVLPQDIGVYHQALNGKLVIAALTKSLHAFIVVTDIRGSRRSTSHCRGTCRLY
jgi:hypothetical protein